MNNHTATNIPNANAADVNSVHNHITHFTPEEEGEKPVVTGVNNDTCSGVVNPVFHGCTSYKNNENKNLSNKIPLNEVMDVPKNLSNNKENGETPNEDSRIDQDIILSTTQDSKHDKHEISIPQPTNRVSLEIPLKDKQSSENDVHKSTDCVLKDVCEEDPDTLCGIGSFHPKWLQPWATPRVFLLFYSLLGVISGTYYTYRVGTISTLEKRFSFNTRISGTIMLIDEVTLGIMGVVVGYFGGKTHRPRMFGIGMLMATLCCLVSALPYFIYGPAQHFGSMNIKNDTDEAEVCESEITRENCLENERPPTIPAVAMFMTAGFLKAFGNLAYHSIGLSYMDDTAKKKNTSLYFAVAFSLRLVGPMIGFLMSYYFLKINENPFANPGYGPEDPRWIGAWWLGFFVQGILLFVCTIPLALFPRRLPGRKAPPSEEKRPSLSDMISSSKRILKSPLYWSIVMNTVFEIGSFGHFVMLPKYMENQFRLTASDASLLSGPPGIAAVMASTVVGGYLVWKHKPSAKFLIASMCVMEIVGAAGFLLLMIPRCEKVEMANFGLNNEGLILDGECNFNCNCTHKAFSPICGPDGRTVYFTPCFAGCTEKLNKTFSSCSCVSDPAGQQASFATEGFCVTDDCWSQALGYVVTLPVLRFICSLLTVQYSVILLRAVSPKDKSIALGMFESLISSIGFAPYLLIFGSLVDSTCLVWEKSCGETGNCWFYDTDQFNNMLHSLSAGFSALAALSLLATYFLSGPIGDLYQEDTDSQNETKQNEAITSM